MNYCQLSAEISLEGLEVIKEGFGKVRLDLDLTWNLLTWQSKGLGMVWERLRGRDKPLKGNVRAVLSFLGLLQHLFAPSADTPSLQRKSHRLGCLHVPVSSWRIRKINLNTF